MLAPLIEAIAASLSVVSCALMLWHLRRAPATVKRRLFWQQLATLAIFDLLKAAWKIMKWCYFDVWPKPRFLPFDLFFEMSSCFTELCIAAGFLAAAAGWNRTVAHLRIAVTLPLCIVLNLSIVIPRLVLFDHVGFKYWRAAFLTAYFCATTVLYLCGLVFALSYPPQIRRYASVRALSYMTSFTLTTLPLVIWLLCKDLIAPGEVHDGWFRQIPVVVYSIFNLSGAVNAMTYAFWVARPRERTPTQSFQSFCEKAAIAAFFDLDPIDGEEEDGAALASRIVGIAVAEAREVRAGMSV